MLSYTVKNNESGFILITVSVLSLVMMIIALGVISLSTSQSISNQHQIERIKANQLAEGAWSFKYSGQIAGSTINPNSETIDGKTYTVTINPPTADTGPFSTETYSIQVQY